MCLFGSVFLRQIDPRITSVCISEPHDQGEGLTLQLSSTLHADQATMRAGLLW